MEIFGAITPGQVSVLVGFVPVIVAWLYSELLVHQNSSNISRCSDADSVEDDSKIQLLEGGTSEVRRSSPSFLRFLLMDKDFLLENHSMLRSLAEFGAILILFYICDGTNLFGESDQYYSRDLFLFLYFLLIVVAAITSVKNHQNQSPVSGKSVRYLNRDQTEEWKGWMQVLFVMYHYFSAIEIYNAIRVFVASYVWMTGFGNFSYYYVRKDFSFSRFAQVLMIRTKVNHKDPWMNGIIDRYIWILGMIYAYYHPTVERWMEKLEETKVWLQMLIKTSIAAVCFVVGYLWYEYVFKLDMHTYLAFHPYTSWIPITVYIVMRNITQRFRNYTLALFGWLGKITLETYISQGHIWMRTGGPNKRPRKNLSLIPHYPMLNFLLTTAVYVTVAHRVFGLTNKLKMAFVPTGDDKRVLRNIVVGAIAAVILYCFSLVLFNLPKMLV